MHFGDKLKVLRKHKEWTQPQLAEAIGIEQSYLSKLENGKSIPSADVFDLILKVFKTNTETLLEDIDQSVVHRQLRQIPEVANFLNRRNANLTKHRRAWLIGSSLMVCLGVVATISSYFGLIFPETHYNYHSKGVVLPNESKEIFHNYLEQEFESREAMRQKKTEMAQRLDEVYLLSSSYRGNIFNVSVEGGSRTYQLNHTVTMQRVENRYLAVSGLLLFLMGAFGFVLEKKFFRNI